MVALIARRFVTALVAVTLLALLAIAAFWWRNGDLRSLWLTSDQQARLLYESLQFANAAETFEDPMWRGRAAYAAGQYEQAAEAFGRIPDASGFFNRGNALMKAFEYRQAIAAYELAVEEDPEWQEASENLQLARYVLDYIERAREQGDTGDETELGADDYRFDNTAERGREMTITRDSTIELESAEKWMRSVDTETRDFLRARFDLEAQEVNRQ